MSLNDSLSSAMSKIQSHEKVGKKDCIIKPTSITVKRVLDILNAEGYIGAYEEVDDSKGKHLKLNLLGNINKCGAIKPTFSVKINDYDKFEKRFLPAKGFGVLILTTSQGLMTHYKSKEKKIGGKLVAYCY